MNVDPGNGMPRQVGARNDSGSEAELGGFLQPLLPARRGADFARQTDFSKDDDTTGQGTVAQGG